MRNFFANFINVFNVKQLVDEFKLTLHNYEAEDYLLLSGNVVVNVLVAMILIDEHKRLKILIFDAANKTYVPREVGIEQIQGKLGGIYQ